ncbi:MAG: hypothetical protein WBA31_04410 [Candidatus Dormiibacterota bacterium]
MVWILRRPDQFLHPYIWDEEFLILNRFQQHGLLAAIMAHNQGYFLWPTSISVAMAAAVSFEHLPRIEYLLCTAWFLATMCLILIPHSPFRLRWRIGFVVLMVLAPMNPEVFGVALYSFWWTSLWPLISLIWSKENWGLRVPVLILGGMSSLAGAALVVPYAFMFATTRQRRYLAGTVILAIVAVVQTLTYLTSTRSGGSLNAVKIFFQELHNFSDYALTWLRPSDSNFLDLAGATILLGICIAIVHSALARNTRHIRTIVALAIGLVIMGILSAAPAPLISDPIAAGPRYYFLPFVLLGWVLLMVVATTELRWAKVAGTILIGISLLTLTQSFSRHEVKVSWSAQLSACKTATGTFYVPVQYDGVTSQMWKHSLIITAATCRSLGM